LLVLAGCASAVAAEDPKTQPAIEAAKTWLAHVDAGDHGRAHDQAATYFRGAVTRDAWITAASGVRKPLGKVITRELAGATFTKSLPGAPDGEYVVIHFNTSFENKKSAVETITPMRDKDGSWRVSGYFVK
jgi:hypothetical protein